MCGIVGVYLKTKKFEKDLGKILSGMLNNMESRGPDSAGFALYGNEPSAGHIKVTLRHDGGDYDWQTLAHSLGEFFACEAKLQINANYAVIAVRADEEALAQALADKDPGLTIMSIGRRIEIFKEIGSPLSIVDRFGIRGMRGTHIIGHTRMATESAVTTDGSHPFSTGMDCRYNVKS